MLNIGGYFWEYNSGVGYKRKAHSQKHIDYFRVRYGVITFYTKEELLSVYPDAVVD